MCVDSENVITNSAIDISIVIYDDCFYLYTCLQMSSFLLIPWTLQDVGIFMSSLSEWQIFHYVQKSFLCLAITPGFQVDVSKTLRFGP